MKLSVKFTEPNPYKVTLSNNNTIKPQIGELQKIPYIDDSLIPTKLSELENDVPYIDKPTFDNSNKELYDAIQRIQSGITEVKIGKGLKYNEDNAIVVDTVDKVEQDNTLPITSAGVYMEIGNIEALLKII